MIKKSSLFIQFRLFKNLFIIYYYTLKWFRIKKKQYNYYNFELKVI